MTSDSTVEVDLGIATKLLNVVKGPDFSRKLAVRPPSFRFAGCWYTDVEPQGVSHPLPGDCFPLAVPGLSGLGSTPLALVAGALDIPNNNTDPNPLQ